MGGGSIIAEIKLLHPELASTRTIEAVPEMVAELESQSIADRETYYLFFEVHGGDFGAFDDAAAAWRGSRRWPSRSPPGSGGCAFATTAEPRSTDRLHRLRRVRRGESSPRSTRPVRAVVALRDVRRPVDFMRRVGYSPV